MTVIATLITAHYTTHATDSFLTKPLPDGTREVVEDRQAKLVRVPTWRGAMAYWGLAQHGSAWTTLNWLGEQANQAGCYSSAEEFAVELARGLSAELNRHQFARPSDKGLGIHFTAYERVADYWIPEIFLISNWNDTTYTSVRAGGFVVTRETYGTLEGLTERLPEHRERGCRLAVHQALHNRGVMFRFNNGDPILFNPIANSIVDTFLELIRRRQLRDPTDAGTHLSLVRRPVEVVSKLLADLAEQGTRLVGGKPHDLAIAPNGTFTSSTGD